MEEIETIEENTKVKNTWVVDKNIQAKNNYQR